MARGSDVNEAYKGGKKMSLIDFWRSYENREDLGAWPSHTPCQSERLAGRMQAVVQLRAPNHPEMWFITATLRRARILCQKSFFFLSTRFCPFCPTSTVQLLLSKLQLLGGQKLDIGPQPPPPSRTRRSGWPDGL